ncbi:MAG: hypothetical protein M1829_003835 [Trizodia sp. TS-e1964]|nr:MAG: hypothetical protein M1829_003835 [Trizodia sp. TS-e1964]
MPSQASPLLSHIAKHASLLLLSLLFLPLDTYFLLLSYAFQSFSSKEAYRKRLLRSPTFYPKTVLVTSVCMAKGLTLARAFHLAGHTVIGADFEPGGVPVNGRVSRSLRKFYPLTVPRNSQDGCVVYVREMLSIVKREKVDLWVSCSGVAWAEEDGKAQEAIESLTSCKSIQFNWPLTAMLHGKHSFQELLGQLGLRRPETHLVTSRDAAHKILGRAGTRRYVLKSVAIDDATRMDLTLLPQPSLSATYEFLARANISPATPWVLQQFIKGQEYCSHALVINGVVKAFVACRSSDLVMYYEALEPSSPLCVAMLAFTQEFVARSISINNTRLTGHLSFDFLVEAFPGHEPALYPIECNPRAHTATVLFTAHSRNPHLSRQLVQKYLSILPPDRALANGFHPTNDADESLASLHDDDTNTELVLYPAGAPPCHWLGHSFVDLVLFPLFDLCLGRVSLRAMLQAWATFGWRAASWRDGTYALWDPLPWWWLYHVFWPGKFIVNLITDTRWSRMNVSTTRLFLC